jgi:tellurite resistance protein TerC
VLAVSDDPFIVYTSNAFAILGLRALYFLLSGLLDKFHFLSKGLALILGFIGVKLILQAAHETISTSIPEIPSLVSLGVIVVVLTASVLLSLWRPAKETAEPAGSGEGGEQPGELSGVDVLLEPGDPAGGVDVHGQRGGRPDAGAVGQGAGERVAGPGDAVDGR